ncbi:MAG: diphosphomevalonate decarboxylase, partial [Saprospiraceae bacterium]|nr:diphosphomevalonate decarboxylase [Saprospiraceae bacterium]
MLKDQISGNVRWQSPSNIALIKYWGKYGDQLPQNPSISFTLDKSFTQTKISYRFRPDRHSPISTTFLFEGKENAAFQERIERYLLKRKDFLPFLSDLHLDIESTNSFPHSAGIASSASAFSALA